MRLYNPTSCTPLGSSTKKAKWTLPVGFVPKVELAADESSDKETPTLYVSKTGATPNLHWEMKDDRTPFPADEMSRMSSSTLSTHSTLNNPQPSVRSYRSENINYGIATPFPRTMNAVPVPSPRSQLQSSIRSPPHIDENIPFMIVQSNAPCSGQAPSPPKTKLSPRSRSIHRSTTKENRTPAGFNDRDFVFSSLSMATEASSDFYECPTSTNTESSDDSAWLDFSTDGSENPFQRSFDETHKKANHFSPIKKVSPPRRTTPILNVKPNRGAPVSHGLFPCQPTRYPKTLRPKISHESSAFVMHSMGPSQSHPTIRRKAVIRAASKTLAPSPRDVDPISSFTGPAEKTRPVAPSIPPLKLSKYSLMLKSGFSFVSVRKSMERDGVDAAIIGLASVVSSTGNCCVGNDSL